MKKPKVRRDIPGDQVITFNQEAIDRELKKAAKAKEGRSVTIDPTKIPAPSESDDR